MKNSFGSNSSDFNLSLKEDQKVNLSSIDDDDNCCENPNIIIDRGIYVCSNCGIVKGPTYSMSGARTFSAEDIKNKKINEPYYNDTGYRTLISNPNVDIYGSPLGAKARQKYAKLAKIQKSITNSYERNILVANPIFGRISADLRLSKQAVHEAHNIYKKVLLKKLTTGRSINQIVAACIYIAIRKLNLPRTLEEVAIAAQLEEKKVAKNYRLIVRELGIKLNPQEVLPFISRFGDELNIPSHYQMEAINLFKKARGHGMNINGDPKSYAAAALYIVMKKYKQYKINQNRIAQISYISDVTLRKKMNEIRNAACS
ncbi:MAG: transcription initiation factor IIB [Candidatus Helarchaeota archaeon]